MESLEVLITAFHHALVDVSDPQRVGEDEGQPEQAHEDVGLLKTYQDIANSHNDDGAEEGHHLDGELHAVLEVALGCHLLLQGQRLLVIDGELEDDEMEESSCQQHIGRQHQEGKLTIEDGREHDEIGNNEYSTVEPKLGLEQGDDILAVHHQQVDVVAFLSHDLDQCGDAIDGKTVDAPEVEHHIIVIDGCIGDEQGEHDNQRETHDAARAHRLVAHVRLGLYLQVFADESEAVEEGELRDMLQRLLGFLGDLFIDILELEVAVDKEEDHQHN